MTHTMRAIRISGLCDDFSCIACDNRYNGLDPWDWTASMVRAIQAIGVGAIILAAVVFMRFITGGRRTSPFVGQDTTAIERFEQAGGRIQDAGRDQVPPLVRQAQAFALYLNPPVTSPTVLPPKKVQDRPAMPEPRGAVASITEVRPVSPSAKFELHGISYYRPDPGQSMALICEQGGSRRWVRPGDSVGHMVIEQIESDGLVYRDGAATQRMALAPSETVTKFAQATESSPRPKEPPEALRPSGPAPQPVRGIRQMPRARVAAKLGRTPQEMPWPGPDRTQTE